MRNKAPLWGLGVLILATALAGCGSDGNSARALERLMPRMVGPAQNYEVHVSGASSGRIGMARVRATRLQLDGGPVLDEARVELSDLRFDRDHQKVEGVRRAEFTGLLLQEDLNAYLRSRTSLIHDLRINLTPGGAQLRGNADIPGVRLPITPVFTLEGSLRIDDMGRLCFAPDKIRVEGITVPSVAAKLLATQINPLVDLTTLRLPVYLQHAEPGNREIRLSGRAQVQPGPYPTLDK